MCCERTRSAHHVVVALVIFLLAAAGAQAQITGETPVSDDSVIIFEPALPLLTDEAEARKAITQAGGVDLVFSGSGWGIGAFYHHKVIEHGTAFANFLLSGRRNADEFENAWLGSVPVVAEKVNRLYMIPMTIGFNYRLFAEDLQESFRPYVSAGITPTIIIQTPYIRDGQFYEFFSSFGYAETYFRWGAMVAVGSLFGDPTEGTVVGFTARYYTIPFGGDGLESLQGLPITNFGGVFLSLSLGWTW